MVVLKWEIHAGISDVEGRKLSLSFAAPCHTRGQHLIGAHFLQWKNDTAPLLSDNTPAYIQPVCQCRPDSASWICKSQFIMYLDLWISDPLDWNHVEFWIVDWTCCLKRISLNCVLNRICLDCLFEKELLNHLLKEILWLNYFGLHVEENQEVCLVVKGTRIPVYPHSLSERLFRTSDRFLVSVVLVHTITYLLCVAGSVFPWQTTQQTPNNWTPPSCPPARRHLTSTTCAAAWTTLPHCSNLQPPRLLQQSVQPSDTTSKHIVVCLTYLHYPLAVFSPSCPVS